MSQLPTSPRIALSQPSLSRVDSDKGWAPAVFGGTAVKPEEALSWLRDAAALVSRVGAFWLFVSALVLALAVMSSSSKAGQLFLVSWVVLAGASLALYALQKGALTVGDSIWILLRDGVPAALAAAVLSAAGWLFSGLTPTFLYSGSGIPYIPFVSDVITWHRALLPLAIPSLYVVTLLTLTLPTTYLILLRAKPGARRPLFSAALPLIKPISMACGLVAAVVLGAGVLASVLLPLALAWMSCLMAVIYRAQLAHESEEVR